MAEYASPVIEVVKLVGPTIWKYIKFQITPNSYVTECGSEKDKLQLRLNDIERELQLQLRGIGKIPKQEVEAWLEKARNAIAGTDDEDQFNKGGCSCFCNIRRAKQFFDMTQGLKSIYGDGETYISAGVILVHNDYTVIKGHFLKEFQETHESLQLRKKDIESTLRKQLCFGKVIKEEVNGWAEKVDKKLETAQDEVRQGGSTLSPPLLAQLLERKIRELQDLLENGEKYTIDGVSLVQDDPSTTRGVPLCAEKCYGRDTALAEIPKYLKGDQVTRIAVWGMGDIGKTTVMKQIHNQFLNEPEFDKVIWITVSSILDTRRIQNEIAQIVDKVQMEEDDATRRAGNVSARLRRGKYLLILDDVWEAFSDEDVGIPVESGGLKLVLTTRAADVARKMNCDEIIKLQPLSFEESLQLFREKVGKVVLSDDGNIKTGLEATLKQIVKECDGLPLAIVTVASTMKGMSDDQYSWVKALKQLRKGVSVVEGQKDPKSILKFSYDHLKNEKVQHCFLYCALYPEDCTILKEQVIEYWIEEGLIDEMDTRDEMICEGHDILRKLQDNCLLECIIEFGSLDDDVSQTLGLKQDESVKMHDLLRDMALDITSKSPRLFVKAGVKSPRFFVKAGVGNEELRKKEAWPSDVEKVSFMRNFDHMEEIPWVPTHMKYNMLTTLLMSGTSFITVPESFFMQMPGLRVLDLSWNWKLRSLPDSISDLENLTTLLLQHCGLLKRLPSLSKCQALTKLDLRQSGIEEVPDGMEMLVNLKYLDLSWTQIKLPEGMLPKLSNLQHLVVDATQIRDEDLIMLRKLEYLEARLGRRFEAMIILLRFMQEQLERLTSYTLQGAAPLLSLSLIMNVKRIVARLFNGGKQICLLNSYFDSQEDESRDLKCANDTLVNQSLSLHGLTIQVSKNIECVFGWGFNPLQTLEALRLNHFRSLKFVFDEKALGRRSHSFYPLKSITIERCPKLKMVFSPALLRDYFQNLERISISNCHEIEEIISFTSEDEEAQEKLTLPKLKTLKLLDLPNLKSICSSSSSVLTCDSLEVLEIGQCVKLNRIPLYFPQLDDAHPSSPLSLKKINVDSEKWWRFSTEWCHPKEMLFPFCEFKQRLPEEAPEVMRAAEALLKLIRKTPSDQGPVAQSKLGQ